MKKPKPSRGQTAIEFLLIVAALLVVLAGIIANFLVSSSSMSSGVSGEIENTKEQAVQILKSKWPSADRVGLASTCFL